MLPVISDTIAKHNMLARNVEHDFTRPKKKKIVQKEFDSKALRVLPNTDLIHGRLFSKQEAGDGPKKQNNFQLSKEQLRIEKAKADERAR